MQYKYYALKKLPDPKSKEMQSRPVKISEEKQTDELQK